MSISTLRDQARKHLVEFAWSQWAQSGVSSAPTRTDGWAMDPEALVLFTLEVARRDPRLFDEMLDWLAHNFKLVSVQRLRNLAPRFEIDRDLVDASLSWVEASLRPTRAASRRGVKRKATRPVFDQDVVGFVGEPDPTFARFGYLRPPATRSGKSQAPEVRDKINFAFRVRLLFGPGTRSEILRILLTQPDGPMDAARIAEEAGFAKRNVNETLNALVASHVVKTRWAGNERVFLAYRDKWTTLLELGPTGKHLRSFVSWVHRLPALLEVLRWLEREAAADDSDYIRSSRARDLFERIEVELDQLGIELPSDRTLQGEEFLPTFLEMAEAFVKAATE